MAWHIEDAKSFIISNFGQFKTFFSDAFSKEVRPDSNASANSYFVEKIRQQVRGSQLWLEYSRAGGEANPRKAFVANFDFID